MSYLMNAVYDILKPPSFPSSITDEYASENIIKLENYGSGYYTTNHMSGLKVIHSIKSLKSTQTSRGS